MQILIINANLKEHVTEEQFKNVCDEAVDGFTKLPGLITKYWLANKETNTYGGVYTWKSREDMQNYLDSDFFQSALTDNPIIENLTVKDFVVLDEYTNKTVNLC